MHSTVRLVGCFRIGKSAVLSGLDYGTMIADEALGIKQKKYEYRNGKKLRHIGLDTLWFLYSKNRFRSQPSWFRWFDTNLSFQDFSWRDPLPFICGTIGNIKKQLSPSFRKAKEGLR